MEKYTDYILEQLQKLLSIDSPTGYTKNVTDYLMDEYKAMGYLPTQTVKGGVLVDLGGKMLIMLFFWKLMWILWVRLLQR